MGLFIGASLLTILEIFDYLYEVRLPPPRGRSPAPSLAPSTRRAVGGGR